MRTPTEIEALWHGSLEEPGSARTARNVSVDVTLPAGLYETQVEGHHPDQGLLLNDKAA
jgi:hypothetical protein